MYVLVAGLNHRTAPVEIREKLAITGVALQDTYKQLLQQEGIEGAVIVNTCNRTEVYATTRDIEQGTQVLEQMLQGYSGINSQELKQYLYQPNCYEAIHHLFRVTSGLDSMILGETQVIGQVKDAYITAMEANASDGVLNALFQKALYVGKKVRTETEIDSHPLSISSAAVEMARSVLGDLRGKTVMVVGAGEMSELTTRYLMQHGVQSVIVSNRSYDKALAMAGEFSGRAIRLDEMPKMLPLTDIVISCTAANHYVIRTDNCYESLLNRNGQPVIMIDIAVPRDIDPQLAEIDEVFLYDIDDLQGAIDINYQQREQAAIRAEKIITRELEDFNEWLGSLCVVPVISALKAQAETIKQQEMKKAMNRLGKVSEHEQKVIGTMANAIVNQLLHIPIIQLKEKASTNQGHIYAEVVKGLFNLEIDSEGYAENDSYKAGNQG